MSSPYKPQHQVACAHCRKRPAGDLDCGVCQLGVCEPCAADLTSCPRPAAHLSRLGRGAWLQAVDPDGELAAIARRRGRVRLWSLSGRRYLDRRPPPAAWVEALEGTAVALCRCGEHLLIRRDLEAATGRVAGDRAALDCETGRLALAHRDRLAVYRRRAGRYQPLGDDRVPGREIRWLALGPDRLAAITADGRVLAFRCSDQTWHAMPFYEWIGGERPELRFRPFEDPPGSSEPPPLLRDLWIKRDPVCAAMSTDGRYLAAACVDHRVVVHDLAAGVARVHGDHAAEISCVAIVAGGALLVTGDRAGRIIARERGERGYARRLITRPR